MKRKTVLNPIPPHLLILINIGIKENQNQNTKNQEALRNTENMTLADGGNQGDTLPRLSPAMLVVGVLLSNPVRKELKLNLNRIFFSPQKMILKNCC